MNGERVDTDGSDDSDDRDATAAAGTAGAVALDDEEAVDEHPEPDSRMTPEPPPS